MDSIQDRNTKQKIAEYEAQIEDLLNQINELQKTLIDWHSAMYGAINLILKPHMYNLEMERELLLNLMPRRIDCMVIKKNASIPIDLDMFRIFRKHNVLELKSPHGPLTIDTIWNTISYATQYMSIEENAGDRPISEITITIIRSAYPVELFKQLKELGWTIEEKSKNIFYLSGIISIPIQIVIPKDMDEVYTPLLALSENAPEPVVRKLVEYCSKLTDKRDKEFAEAVLWACAEANKDVISKLKKEDIMSGVLMDIMKEDFDKVRLEGIREGAREATASALASVAEDMINDDQPGELIAKYSHLGRQEIDVIAKRMNHPVVWRDN